MANSSFRTILAVALSFAAGARLIPTTQQGGLLNWAIFVILLVVAICCTTLTIKEAKSKDQTIEKISEDLRTANRIICDFASQDG